MSDRENISGKVYAEENNTNEHRARVRAAQALAQTVLRLSTEDARGGRSYTWTGVVPEVQGEGGEAGAVEVRIDYRHVAEAGKRTRQVLSVLPTDASATPPRGIGYITEEGPTSTVSNLGPLAVAEPREAEQHPHLTEVDTHLLEQTNIQLNQLFLADS